MISKIWRGLTLSDTESRGFLSILMVNESKSYTLKVTITIRTPLSRGVKRNDPGELGVKLI